MVSMPRHSSDILGTTACRLRRNMANGHATDCLSASMMGPVGRLEARERSLWTVWEALIFRGPASTWFLISYLASPCNHRPWLPIPSVAAADK